MEIKQEGEYEDSYKKRERLESELMSTITSIRDSFSVFRKDSGEIADSFEKCDAIKKRMDELILKEDNLCKGLKEQRSRFADIGKSEADIDAKIDSSAAISSEISSIQEKISEIISEEDFLMKELEAIVNKEPGQRGDLDGTIAVIKMKMQTAEEIKNQLDELDMQDGF